MQTTAKGTDTLKQMAKNGKFGIIHIWHWTFPFSSFPRRHYG